MAAPKFSELYHTGRMDDLFHVARKSSKLIFWTTAPILITLVLFGRPLLGLFFGEDFTVAYVALIMLAIGQLVNSVCGSTGYFMNMTGHQNAFRNIMFCSALINITLSLALIPRFGMNGAAFAGMVSLASWNIYTLIYIRVKFGRTIGYVPLLERISVAFVKWCNFQIL
jgi:O-antigen/teichoic acid export membrane protein